MSFTDRLKNVIDDLEGARGMALVGMDGIVVEEQKKDSSLDLQSLGAEWSTVLKQMDKGMASMDLGETVEFCVLSEKEIILARRIHEEYFLLLSIQASGNFGKGRYLLRREAVGLKGEL